MGDAIRLDGKVAIVTGGGRGLGRAMALALAEAGARVVAVAEPAVVRAALVYALKAPPSTYWNVDVGPLSAVGLVGDGRRWSLRIGAPV